MTKLIVGFRHFANAPKNVFTLFAKSYNWIAIASEKMPTSSGLLRGVRWLKPTFRDYLLFPYSRIQISKMIARQKPTIS
jgi:hypothetical protein